MVRLLLYLRIVELSEKEGIFKGFEIVKKFRDSERRMRSLVSKMSCIFEALCVATHFSFEILEIQRQ